MSNAAKAEKLLGWKANTKFKELVTIIIKEDYEKLIIGGF